GEKGDTGPQGPKGDTGPQGPGGNPGRDGIVGYDVVGRTSDSSVEDGLVTLEAPCYGDKVAIGGGFRAYEPKEVTVHSSYPLVEMVPGSMRPGNEAGTWHATGWIIQYTNEGSSKVQPYVLCALVR
ncbi:MAG TPA: hypothetical protein VFM50_10880, partial [Nocardioidaceae bacterium]|nr:hypothetical protein [Nocardioidaceae bacterium]